MAGNYFDLLKAVENYYGAGSDQWIAMASHSATAAEQAAILKQVPNVYTTVNEAGQITSWSLGVEESMLTAGEAAASNAAAVINSNAVSAGSKVLTMEVPGNAKLVEGAVQISSGATKVGAAGTGTATLECVLGHAATWLLGAGIGMKLGVWIDGGLYNINPEFWDAHNMRNLNPQTWDEHVVTNWLLKQSGYPVAPVLSDAEGQFYCDEELFAYFTKYMLLNDFFNSGAQYAEQGEVPDSKFYHPELLLQHPSVLYSTALHNEFTFAPAVSGTQNIDITDNEGEVYTALFGVPAGYPLSQENYGYCLVVCASENPFTVNNTVINTPTTMKDGSELYIAFPFGPITSYESRVGDNFFVNPFLDIVGMDGTTYHEYIERDIPYLLVNGVHRTESQKEGVHTYDQMPVLDPSMSLADILDALKQQYPDLFDDRARVGTLNDDGTITDRFYIPFNIPSGGEDTQPQTRPTDKTKINPNDDPDIDPDDDTQAKTARKITNPGKDPDKPEDPGNGIGTTPPYVAPTGTAEALYAIYNPTLAQVKSLGAWLWSSNFVDQLLKLFNNPMDAIISLHKIYGSPHTSGAQNIKVGYLDSGVSSKVVDEQYITIDCGTVNIYESFSNIFDYAPHTEINLYLPFVGIVSLDVADVMRGRVNVIYHIDVITGAVLVEVKILRDGQSGGVIYQYTGSCAEHYPLSSGSYIGIVTGAAGIVGGIAATVASGGAAAPMLLGAAAGISGMHANIQRSNSFTANAGAMGIKKPYFIISRPQTAMARDYEHYTGIGSNSLVTLASLSGYVKVNEIYLINSNTGMTDAEQQKIKDILKKGVVV